MQTMLIDFHNLLVSLSMALDFHGQGLMRHHVRVALIAEQIARKLAMKEKEIDNLVSAALIHDLGADTFKEKSRLVQFEVNNPENHCRRGYHLTASSTLLKPLGEIILYHHDRWDGKNNSGLKGDSIPLASRIIHLADRIDVLIKENRYILSQRQRILYKVKSLSGSVFDRMLVDVFQELSLRESFWLDLVHPRADFILKTKLHSFQTNVTAEDLISISEVFAQVIDGKSRFTHLHSRLVAGVAEQMAVLAGFTAEKCTAMRVAGLLHDLGKTAIPEEILEKPGRLTEEEYSIIKSHTYYTYRILEMLDNFEEIKCWAAYHHEKLNGRGYPFRIAAEGLDDGSRILAVSDVFAALIEDRPYRQGLPRHKVEQILLEKTENLELDRRWVELLLDNYNQLAEIKMQLKA